MKRRCTTCRKMLPLSAANFARVTSVKSALKFKGFSYRCKPCATTWTKKHPNYAQKLRERNREYMNLYLKNPKNQHKLEARILFRAAINRGDLQRMDKCEECGSMANVEGHHDDYSKPLEVRWLCKKHHYVADKQQKIIEGNKLLAKES